MPKLTTFPDATTLPDPLTAIPDEARSLLTPELALLMGDQAAVYPETRFGFEREVPALAGLVRERTEVRARLFSVPLSRFGVVAYDLPAEIGLNPGPALRAISDAPAGLVAARDGASRSDLAQGATSLPYHYRRRASVAAAYQYVFSQRYVDRVAEYAGVSHYCDLDAAPSSTAVLAGMSTSGPASQWDLAAAGRGTYGTISLFRDAAVVFTEQPGRSLHLHDSGSAANTTPLLVLVLGPSDTRAGSLALRISSVARPVVLVGYNVNVQVDDGTSVNGAIFLDPASSLAATGTMRVGHLSYWAGSPSVTAAAVVAGAMPASAAALAPRVVFIATAASRS